MTLEVLKLYIFFKKVDFTHFPCLILISGMKIDITCKKNSFKIVEWIKINKILNESIMNNLNETFLQKMTNI